MKAKFIRDQENPLDSLEIGKVLERKLEQKGKEIYPYLKKVAEEYNCNDIKTIINLENKLIQKSFILNDDPLYPVFYITYELDFGFFVGWYIQTEKDAPYKGEQRPIEKLNKCVEQLKHWIKYYKNYL